MNSIFVLAGTTMGSVLSLCKNASKCGAEVYVISFKENFYRFYKSSKYINQTYYIQTNNLLLFCEKLLKEKQFKIKPILYTTTDSQCLLINKNRKEYEEIFNLCLPSSQIINNFTQKGKAEILAKEHGLFVPKSMIVKTKEDLNYISDHFKFPIIIKPISAITKQKVGFKFKIFDKNTFIKKNEVFLNNLNNIICQEYIPGDDNSYWFYIFYRNNEGNIIECMGQKTLQTNGIMTIGTTRFNENLSNLSKMFLEKIDYVGIGGLEFKLYNGKYYFIEMSTRTEGFLPISDMAGVSCALASYNWLSNKTLPYSKLLKRQKDNVQYTVFFNFFIDYVKTLKVFSLIKLIFSLMFCENKYSVENFIDKKPYRKNLSFLLIKFFKKL